MCTGAEIALVASGLASAGGSFLNAKTASNNAQAKINAKNAAAVQEGARQKQFQAQNDTALNQSLKDFDSETRDQNFGDLVAKREQAYEANSPAPQEFAAISADAPQVVKDDKASRVANELSKSKQQAKALARIGGTADLFQNNGLSINKAANDIGTTNNLARGSLEVNKIEQIAAANNAGNKSSMFGDLLGAAGAIGAGAATKAGGLDRIGDLFSKSVVANVGANPALAAVGPFDASLPWRNAPVGQTGIW